MSHLLSEAFPDHLPHSPFQTLTFSISPILTLCILETHHFLHTNLLLSQEGGCILLFLRVSQDWPHGQYSAGKGRANTPHPVAPESFFLLSAHFTYSSESTHEEC
jgi:hypothetical protein